MPKHSSTPKDTNQLAAYILNQTIKSNTSATPPAHQKNPAAVALGRLGGLKGGKARADKLSPRKLKEIARKAAEARWRKTKKLVDKN